MALKTTLQTWLKHVLNDPITMILSQNSNLTKIQLETLMIDTLSESIAGHYLIYDEKAKLRLKSSRTTRGAFNRTLKQAKTNIVRAIYTILLLGYLGVFESATLDPYLEVANNLKSYTEAQRNDFDSIQSKEEYHNLMQNVRRELTAALEKLSHI